jgi:hypothetical protein
MGGDSFGLMGGFVRAPPEVSLCRSTFDALCDDGVVDEIVDTRASDGGCPCDSAWCFLKTFFAAV